MLTALAIASLLCTQVDVPGRSARLTEGPAPRGLAPEWVRPTVWASAVSGTLALLPGTIFVAGAAVGGAPSYMLAGLLATGLAVIASSIVLGMVILGILMHDGGTRGMQPRPLAVAPYLMGALGLLIAGGLTVATAVLIQPTSFLGFAFLVMTPIIVGPVIVALLLTAGVVGIVNAIRASQPVAATMEGLGRQRGVEVLAF